MHRGPEDVNRAMCANDNQELTSEELEIRRRVLSWARKALTTPTTDLKRHSRSEGEAVCPFLLRSLESGYCYVHIYSEKNAKVDFVRQLTLDARDNFEALPPSKGPDTAKKSLMMVFPNWSASLPRILEDVRRSLKTDFIRSGLMLAPFYDGRNAGSIWNPHLKVFSSPVPLIAIRYMAKHDVYFLANNAVWFREFDKRFGATFQNEQALTKYEKAMCSVYKAAKARFVKA